MRQRKNRGLTLVRLDLLAHATRLFGFTCSCYTAFLASVFIRINHHSFSSFLKNCVTITNTSHFSLLVTWNLLHNFFFYVSMLNKPDTNDKKALLTIEKYITIVQVKDQSIHTPLDFKTSKPTIFDHSWMLCLPGGQHFILDQEIQTRKALPVLCLIFPPLINLCQKIVFHILVLDHQNMHIFFPNVHTVIMPS